MSTLNAALPAVTPSQPHAWADYLAAGFVVVGIAIQVSIPLPIRLHGPGRPAGAARPAVTVPARAASLSGVRLAEAAPRAGVPRETPRRP